MQVGAKKLNVLAMSLGIEPLVTALEAVLSIKKATLPCTLWVKEFKFRSVLLEHIAVKHMKNELMTDYPECFANKQV